MPKPSPYFTFIRYYRDGERKKGRNLSIDQAKAEADPIWEGFSESDKTHFAEMAEVQTLRPGWRRRPPPPPAICPQRVKMRGFIDMLLKDVADIRTHFFHFVSFHQASSRMLPSELSILRFSIERGADHFMHFLFNPEVSPSQFKLFCEPLNTKLTVIPIEGTPNSRQNLQEVLDAIHNFTGGVVYTMSHDHQNAVKCFSELKECSGFVGREILPFDGEELIQVLWERSPEGHNAQLLQVRETCSSQSGLDCLACVFHKASKDTGVCTLWKPFRLAYGFSQILAQPYDMRIAEGFHKLRRNWQSEGTYFTGKGAYEVWHFERAAAGWDSDAPSSSAQIWGADSW